MSERDVDAIRRYFARTVPPPRGSQYFADLHRRITAVAESESQPAHVPSHDDRWEQVTRHRDRLLRLARSRTGTREDAEDIVSEAMLRCVAVEELDPGTVEQFLISVTVRLCADLARHHRRSLAATPPLPDEASPEEVVLERQVLTDLLAALPNRQRELLMLRASGLSVTEIARRHQITYLAAERSIARASRAMRMRRTTARANLA
jgi:RNA polymerase sigma factor (sigma-70 family)